MQFTHRQQSDPPTAIFATEDLLHGVLYNYSLSRASASIRQRGVSLAGLSCRFSRADGSGAYFHRPL